MAINRITAQSLSDGTITAAKVADDMATQAELDTKLNLSGGTLTGNLSLGDSVIAKFGAGDDLQIYHDGSNSYVYEAGTGDLTLQTNGAKIGLASASPFEWMVEANVDSNVSLYYNGSPKLSTTSTGIDVTGSVTANTLVGGSSNFDIKQNTSDGSDNQRTRIGGGGDVVNSRGAFIELHGNEHTATGKAIINAGNITGGEISLRTGGSEKVVVDKDGNVGISETSPSYPLHVDGTIKATGTNNLPALIVDGNSTNEGDIVCADGAALAFGHHTLDGNTGSFTERMRISPSGKVGIGTTSTSGFLTVTGSEGSQYSGSFTNTSTQGWGLFVKGGADADDYSLRVQNKDATELLSVKSNGNVGIGKSSPEHKLVIKSNGAVSYNGATDLDGESFLKLEGANENGEAAMIRWANHGSMNNYFGVVQVGSGGPGDFVWASYNASSGYAETMRITSDGTVTKPLQPAFTAFNSGNWAMGTDVIFDTEGTWFDSVDIGNNFNTSNGKFTAPVSGVYYMSWGITVTGTNTNAGDGSSAVLYKNGNSHHNDEMNYITGPTGGEEQHSGNSMIMDLSANDYIQLGYLGLSANSGFNVQYAHMSGHLVG